jgi:predicted NBD/HSP70 family sugar kinase
MLGKPGAGAALACPLLHDASAVWDTLNGNGDQAGSANVKCLEEAVFWEVFHHSSTRRRELAAKLGVSGPTISRSIEVLTECSLVGENKTVISGRGRHPGVLHVNPDIARLLGVEVDRDHITVVITGMGGELLGRASERYAPADSLPGTMEVIRKLTRVALDDADIELGQVSRIGVGHTGALDLENGVCLSWGGAAGWKQVPLRKMLADDYGIEVTMDDRARAMAMTARFHSPEDGHHLDALYVILGTGIGCGVFVGGRLVRGANQAAGELGHMVVDRNGPLCSCGAAGCVEAIASIPAILRSVEAAVRAGRSTLLSRMRAPDGTLTIDHIVRAANQADPLAVEILDEAGGALGTTIANAVNLLNPSLVVLCGKLAHTARERLLRPVSEVIQRRCFEVASRRLVVRLAPFRKDAIAVGCALLAAQDHAAFELQRRLTTNPEPRRRFRASSTG